MERCGHKPRTPRAASRHLKLGKRQERDSPGGDQPCPHRDFRPLASPPCPGPVLATGPSSPHPQAALGHRRCDPLPCAWEVRVMEGKQGDFPGGSLVENSPSSAGDVGSIPGQGTKVPHPMGQLSQCIATTEPRCFGAHTPQ